MSFDSTFAKAKRKEHHHGRSKRGRRKTQKSNFVMGNHGAHQVVRRFDAGPVQDANRAIVYGARDDCQSRCPDDPGAQRSSHRRRNIARVTATSDCRHSRRPNGRPGQLADRRRRPHSPKRAEKRLDAQAQSRWCKWWRFTTKALVFDFTPDAAVNEAAALGDLFVETGSS